MITLAQVCANPFYTFGIGLALGLWVAANVWIYRYACGYRAGVKMCTEQLEPVRAEIEGLMKIADRDHRLSDAMREEIRLKMQAEPDAEEPRETRH